MKISEFLLARTKKLSLPFSEEEVKASLRLASLDPESSIYGEGGLGPTEDKNKIDIVFAGLVYEILISPDIKEGDYAVNFDRASIKQWYAAECERLEIPNLLISKTDVVKNLSFLA